ncbi:hypothetical protein HZA57_04265 [Candidatus Poribacteria bacterium]|nr:hypothetical protein [Candidatus Poribacteria bacterium]
MVRKLTTAVQLLVLGAVLCLGLASLPGAHGEEPSPAPAESLGIIVTYGSAPAFTPLGAPEGLDGLQEFKNTVAAVHSANSSDLLVDLGAFAAPAAVAETAYYSPRVSYYLDEGFDAINVTSQDLIHFGLTSMGVHNLPEAEKGLFLGNLDMPLATGTPLVTDKFVTKAGRNIHIVSTSDPDKLSGLPLVRREVKTVTAEDLLTSATSRKTGPLVVMSDFDPSRNDAFAGQFGAIDLILETAAGGPEPRKIGSTFIMPRQADNQIARLLLHFGEDGRIASIDSVRTPWISEEEYARLQSPPLPVIGMSVRPAERVAQQFNVSEDNVQVDVHRDASFPELTSRKNIYVYHLEAEGNRFHFYRVHHLIGDGWMSIDVLVLMNADHTIRGLVTNFRTYPVQNFDTTMGQVLPLLFNRAPEEWEIPAEMMRGYKTQGDEMIKALRKTIELDRILYPTGKLAEPPEE